MKESKFIELLNLYVDQQITAGDAALLESEIQRNAERHRVYRQYCQMQRACTILAENFRNQVPSAEDNVVPFRPRRRTPVAVYISGLGLAAAACLAFVFTHRPQPQPVPAAAPAVAVATAPSAYAGQLKSSLEPATHPRPALQTVFTGLVADGTEAEPAALASNRGQYEWMNRVQVQRVSVEDLRFQTKPALSAENRAFSPRPAYEGQVEMTAFRFSRGN